MCELYLRILYVDYGRKLILATILSHGHKIAWQIDRNLGDKLIESLNYSFFPAFWVENMLCVPLQPPKVVQIFINF